MQVFFCIDYHLATADIAVKARAVSNYNDQKFSDHALVTVEYELGL